MSSLTSQTLLLIPVYNHGKTLRTVVEKALAAGWPVLVVDDGSTDGGPETIADLDCRVHRLPQNQGKGAAILAGAQLAAAWGYKCMVTVDADGQLDPAEAGLLVAEAEQEWPVLVIGNRRMSQETVPKSSLFGRSFSNFWVRLECGRDLPDTQSGLRLYPVAELLALAIRTRRYDFEIESLVRLAWSGVAVRSVAVSVHYPPAEERESHFNQLRDNIRLTRLHTRLVLRALNPWPHSGRLPRPRDFDFSVLHPIRLLKTLCLEHTSALQLAMAVWMGLFLGALPLIACHTVAILYVTHRLHLNKVAAVAASQFCMPPLVPALCIEVGYFMRHGSWLLDVSWEIVVLQIHERLWEWLLGSLLVGPFLGMVGGTLTYFGVRSFRARRVAGCGMVEGE